jgi:dephospho-CoA kinase
MKKIGITGSYMSGLESMDEIFACYGFPVFQADLCIKFLLNWREDILREARIQFGTDIMQHGFIQPHKFASSDKFNRLLSLIDIDLQMIWLQFLEKHKKSKLVFFKSHIIYERKWYAPYSSIQEPFSFDKVIYVHRPVDKRVPLISRSLNISQTEARNLALQAYSERDKISKSDYIINAFDNLSLLTQFESIKYMLLEKDQSDLLHT